MSHTLLEPSASSIAPHLVPRERLREGTVRFRLDARPSTVEVQGLPAQVLGYNGTLPGPLLLLQEGERVQVVLRNHLSEPTRLHLYGLSDAVEEEARLREVAPGAEGTYALEVPAGAAGTYWYHPQAMRQRFAGLAGPLLVRGPQDREEPLASAQELVLLLQDLTFEGGRPVPLTGEEEHRGKAGQLLLVNGQVHPCLQVRTGLLRLRLVNASTARTYHLQVPGHPLHVTRGERRPAGVAGPHAPLPLEPGGCADVLVEARQPGVLQLVHAALPPPAVPLPLLALQVEGEPVRTRLPLSREDDGARDGGQGAGASSP